MHTYLYVFIIYKIYINMFHLYIYSIYIEILDICFFFVKLTRSLTFANISDL